MKVKLVTCLLTFLTLNLTSCQNNQEGKIFVWNNLIEEQTYFELDNDSLLQQIETKQSFPLLFYSSTCESCESLKKILNQYLEKNEYVFYSYRYVPDVYKQLMDSYPNIFTNEVITPRILLFKNGQLEFEVNNNKFASYTALSKVLNRHLSKSNVSLIDSDSLIEKDSAICFSNLYEKTNSFLNDYAYTSNKYSFVNVNADSFVSVYKNRELTLSSNLDLEITQIVQEFYS